MQPPKSLVQLCNVDTLCRAADQDGTLCEQDYESMQSVSLHARSACFFMEHDCNDRAATELAFLEEVMQKFLDLFYSGLGDDEESDHITTVIGDFVNGQDIIVRVSFLAEIFVALLQLVLAKG